MKKLSQLLIIIALLTAAGAVVFVFSTDEQVMVLEDGTIKTVDEIWESGDSIFYEVNNEIFLLDQDEIKSYGKRNIGHLFREIKRSTVQGLDNLETKLNKFFNKNNISVEFKLTQYIFLLGLPAFLLVVFFSNRSAKKKPKPVGEEKDYVAPPEEKVTDEVPTRLV